MTTDPQRKKIEWLTVLVVGIVGLALLMGYIALPEPTTWYFRLAANFIPSALVGVVAFLLVYFFFTLKGINVRSGLNEERIINAVITGVTKEVTQKIPIHSSVHLPSTIGPRSLPEEVQQQYERRFSEAQQKIVKISPRYEIAANKEIRTGARRQIIHGKIQDSAADVIVSSDDNLLQAYGGVAKALLDSAGEAVSDGLQRRRDDAKQLRQGQITITSAGALRARAIIHPAVIDLGTNTYPTEEIVRQIVRRCLQVAAALGARTIVFPVLGGGTGASKDFTPWHSIRAITQQVVSSLLITNSPCDVQFELVGLYIYDKNDIEGDLNQLIENAMTYANQE